MVVQGRPKVALDGQRVRTPEPVPERVDIVFGNVPFVIEKIVQLGFAGVVIGKGRLTGRGLLIFVGAKGRKERLQPRNAAGVASLETSDFIKAS
jgi:hypothetical protein